MTEQFSSRVKGLEISGIRKIFEAAGPDSINLGLGQPDFDTPQHIKDAAIAAIRAGKTGYTPNTGIPELRDAISAKFRKENEVSYTPDQILVTAGASEALHIVMQALVSEGDRVLCADPGFVSYAALATLAGGRPVGVPLDKTFHIDIDTGTNTHGPFPALGSQFPGKPDRCRGKWGIDQSACRICN